MGITISFVSVKGGVGKTMLALETASALANDFGKKVLLVDANFSAPNIGLHLDMKDGLTLHDVLGDKEGLHAAIYESFGMDVVPSSLHFKDEIDPYKLKKVLEKHRARYDFIIIDGPPSLGLLTINSLVAADEILIPIQSEYYALEGLGQLLETISLVQANLKPELGIKGAVITMFDKRNKLSTSVMNELYQYFPNRVFRSVIPRSVRLAEAPSYGRSILHYDPKSRGGKAYARLAREILNSEY